MNLFYAIWADAIHHEREKNGGRGHWKIFLFCAMSLLLSLNIGTLYSAILYFTGYDGPLKIVRWLIPAISGRVHDILWAIITLFIPSMIINYFFVFYKRKYRYIYRKYKFRNGRLLLIYYVLTVILLFGFSLMNKFAK